jgi:uncharacterized protein
VVELQRRVEMVANDPDDNVVLDTAINGKAAFIVTGDKHLHALKEFESVRIINVNAALKVLSTESE